MSYLDLILFIFVLVFLTCSKPNNGTVFDKDTTASIRGIAMVGIMLHHIQRQVPVPSHILGSIGYLATALFFFISGFGNTLSLRSKSDIRKKWIIDKFLKIYVPFIVTYFLYNICDTFLYSEQISLSEMLNDILTISLPGQVSWFPKIILFCFVIHYVVKKSLPKENIQITTITIIICGYVAVAYFMGMASYWYNSVVCYPVGCIIALYKGNVEMYTHHKRVIFFASGISFVGSFLLSRMIWQGQFMCSIIFSLMCFAFSMVFITKTKVLSFIGNNSFEYYLFHVLALKLFTFALSISHYAYTAAVILGTSIIVFIYVRIKGMIKHIF